MRNRRHIRERVARSALGRTGRAALCGLLLCAPLGSGCQQSTRVPEPAPDVATELQRARAASAMQEWTEAAGRWGRLLDVGGGIGREAHRQLARALLANNDAENARGVADLGLRLHPQDAELHLLKAHALESLGFRRAAESAYLSSLHAEPDQPETWLTLARLHLDLGLHRSALDDLEQRKKFVEEDADAAWLAGCAWCSSGNWAKAYDAWDRAFSGADNRPERLAEAGGSILDERVAAAVPTAPLRARRWLLAAVDLDPQLSRAHFALGSMAEKDGDFGEALARSERAAELDPSDARVLFALATLCDRLGETQRAAEIARRALKFADEGKRIKRLKQIIESAGPR